MRGRACPAPWRGYRELRPSLWLLPVHVDAVQEAQHQPRIFIVSFELRLGILVARRGDGGENRVEPVHLAAARFKSRIGTGPPAHVFCRLHHQSPPPRPSTIEKKP